MANVRGVASSCLGRSGAIPNGEKQSISLQAASVIFRKNSASLYGDVRYNFGPDPEGRLIFMNI